MNKSSSEKRYISSTNVKICWSVFNGAIYVVCVYICIYVYIYMYVCMYVCMYVYIYIYIL